MTVGSNDTMARRDDGDRILAIGRADGSDSPGMADRTRHLRIGPGLSKGYGEERVPDFLLEVGSNELEWQIEGLAIPAEIALKLVLGVDQDRMLVAFTPSAQPNPKRIVIFPHDGTQSCRTDDQGEGSDR